MGLGGELVKSVFSRNRSTATSKSNVRSNAADKRRWTSVRSYLCGDQFSSVLAEEDSASIGSSEATVTQPIHYDQAEKGKISSDEMEKDEMPEEKQNMMSKVFKKEDAAVIIQAAFRSYLARRENERIKLVEDKQELTEQTESPSRESFGTSIEVQTGNSTELPPVKVDREALNRRMRPKPRTQVLQLKEDWDDSTVSCNISKMRMQNRLEAMTRRERALAYAFSQQLRICSKKKQNISDITESNLSWSWLERWMATRLPESSLADTCYSKEVEPENSPKHLHSRKILDDVTWEEKESCGSNDVSVQFDRFSAATWEDIKGYKPAKNKLKAPKGMSMRKNATAYRSAEYAKVDTPS